MTEAILNFRSDDRLVFLIPDNGPVFLKHADELNALPNVYAYPPIDDQQMPDLYNLADIVVIPSMRCPGTSSDRSPNSLTEAMASGKAVIGTAVGGIPLIMGNAEAAYRSQRFECYSRSAFNAGSRRRAKKGARKESARAGGDRTKQQGVCTTDIGAALAHVGVGAARKG